MIDQDLPLNHSKKLKQVDALSSNTNNGETKIVNIIASFDFGIKLNLMEIAKNCRNCEYNPKIGLVMRIKSPCSTANIFASGKMLIGCKNEQRTILLKKLENQKCQIQNF
jgi:TATA-box binding protein (TBP) (component of TFIID and TFIIIB)